MKTAILLMLPVLMMPLHDAMAEAVADISHPQGPTGLRITTADVTGSGTSVVVDAGISRSRLTRVLAPERLRIDLVNADGTIAASETKVISAADLARLNSTDRHVRVAFENLQAGKNYSVSLRWL